VRQIRSPERLPPPGVRLQIPRLQKSGRGQSDIPPHVCGQILSLTWHPARIQTGWSRVGWKHDSLPGNKRYPLTQNAGRVAQIGLCFLLSIPRRKKIPSQDTPHLVRNSVDKVSAWTV